MAEDTDVEDTEDRQDEQEQAGQVDRREDSDVSVRASRNDGPDTTATLQPLAEASAQDWLGANQDPDVLISIPNFGVDRIALNVEGIRAHAELHAKLLDLLELHVGVDASVDKVELEIDNIRLQAMVKIKLEKVVDIVDRIMTALENKPEILTDLLSSGSSSDKKDLDPSVDQMKQVEGSDEDDDEESEQQ